MSQGANMRKMRIALADNASVELSLAKECVEENGYCWWGTGDNATMASEIIVRTHKDSKQFHGIMEVSELVDAASISQSDFISNRPKNTPHFPSEKTKTQYYKVVSINLEIIPRERVLFARTEQKLTHYQLYPNIQVILTNDD